MHPCDSGCSVRNIASFYCIPIDDQLTFPVLYFHLAKEIEALGLTCSGKINEYQHNSVLIICYDRIGYHKIQTMRLILGAYSP